MKFKLQFLNLFIAFAFLSFYTANSQTDSQKLRETWLNEKEADSVRFKAINDYYKKNTFAQPDSVLTVTDYHFKLAENKNEINEMASAYNEKSYAYYIKGKNNKSKESLEKAIALLEQIDAPITLATMYANLGNIYGIRDDYQEAVKYFSLTLDIYRKENIKLGEARMLNNLGIIYTSLDNYDRGLDNFNKTLAIYDSLNNVERAGSTIANIGFLYFKLGDYEKAIDKGQKSLKILLENNDKFSAADSYFLLAKSHRKLKRNDSAKVYIEKSLSIDNGIKNNSKIIEHLTFKADLEYETNINAATKKAEEVLSLIQPDTENELKADVYKLLYKCYKAQNKYKVSLKMHEKYVSFNDSVKKEKNNNAIIEEAIEKDFNLKLIKNNIENDNAKATLTKEHNYRTYGIIGGSLVLIGIILLYVRKQTLENKNKRDELLAQLEQLKKEGDSSVVLPASPFELNREKLEKSIERKLNETDWTVLNILLEDPVIPNKEIAEKAFMSVDGIGSSLRRMYDYLSIKESKYKKISLLMEAIKISNTAT